MTGFFYRLAVATKDAGERWNMPLLIRAGLAPREAVIDICPIHNKQANKNNIKTRRE